LEDVAWSLRVKRICKTRVTLTRFSVPLIPNTLVAGLEMAVQKFGMRLEVTGTTEQKITIARTAARHGVRVEFSEPAVQQVYENQRSRQTRQRERERDRGDFGR
jgi:hypothetical protein